MADWRDVMRAREEADEEARTYIGSTLTTNDPGVCMCLLALKHEIRALATLLDFHYDDKRTR